MGSYRARGSRSILTASTRKLFRMAAVVIATSLIVLNVMRSMLLEGIILGEGQRYFLETPADPWLEEQLMRRQLLRNVCKRYAGEVPSIEYDNITAKDLHLFREVVVNEKYKAAFSPLAKVSCSSWKLLLLAMSGDFDNKTLPGNPHDWNLLKEHGWTRLHTLGVDQIKHVLKTYTKFLVVRHPYLRLHSAFTEKFQKFPNGKPNPIYPARYGTRAIKKYWTNPSPEALKTGLNISFEDFIHFVGDPELKPDYKFDPHWIPYYMASSPCVVRYDYILRMENTEEDAERFLRDILNTTYRLGHKNVYHHTNVSAFKNIPDNIMQNLWSSYHYDLELFGYQWPIKDV